MSPGLQKRSEQTYFILLRPFSDTTFPNTLSDLSQSIIAYSNWIRICIHRIPGSICICEKCPYPVFCRTVRRCHIIGKRTICLIGRKVDPRPARSIYSQNGSEHLSRGVSCPFMRIIMSRPTQVCKHSDMNLNTAV